MKIWQVTGIPVVFISALEGRGRAAVMHQVLDTYQKWCLRLPTARLNRWLRKVNLLVFFFCKFCTLSLSELNFTHWGFCDSELHALGVFLNFAHYVFINSMLILMTSQSNVASKIKICSTFLWNLKLPTIFPWEISQYT